VRRWARDLLCWLWAPWALQPPDLGAMVEDEDGSMAELGSGEQFRRAFEAEQPKGPRGIGPITVRVGANQQLGRVLLHVGGIVACLTPAEARGVAQELARAAEALP